jgi:hypothetical protein
VLCAGSLPACDFRRRLKSCSRWNLCRSTRLCPGLLSVCCSRGVLHSRVLVQVPTGPEVVSRSRAKGPADSLSCVLGPGARFVFGVPCFPSASRRTSHSVPASSRHCAYRQNAGQILSRPPAVESSILFSACAVRSLVVLDFHAPAQDLVLPLNLHAAA